ncbi:BQ5605_C004g02750 [Microbotryum silenes-dioicae]|uniref:BQ5605_C004g02750 protein n=1 Tax=Microbotryum silenes-dioicae TaxID=796604 RepID=A0A2X0M8L4_9BASI|nr:BQ5605_C004g02750 [Microbotryum silenes-dioicae]
MPTALHLLSYVAGSGAFLVVLLSFGEFDLVSITHARKRRPGPGAASSQFSHFRIEFGLLYLAEVIEEHAAQAKVMGQRMVWVSAGPHAVFAVVVVDWCDRARLACSARIVVDSALVNAPMRKSAVGRATEGG